MNIFKYLKAAKKVLGMNARILQYGSLNDKKSRNIADSKLLSKKLLAKHGLPVSDVYSIISNQSELRDFDWSSLPKSFVLKPNRGIGGGGIVVAFTKKGDEWVSAAGKRYDKDALSKHIANILDGRYSLSHIPDIAFFEERIKVHPNLKPYSFKGIPDVRVIVYNNVPVMAMLRLPTKKSAGKANLAQGGIGVGIDISNGRTTNAIIKGPSYLEYYPSKKKLSLRGIKIPYWKKILRIAIEATKISGLAYAGIDIAIDKDHGPIILELNARPGLSIQNCNLSGLRGRLDRIKGLKVKTVTKGVQLGINLYGGEIEQELENISGKEVIGLSEEAQIQVLDSDDVSINILAKVDTGAYSSSVDRFTLEGLGFKEAFEMFDKLEKPKNFPREKAKEIGDRLTEEIHKYTDKIEKVKVIYAANGVAIRPYVNLKVKISDFEFETRVSVENRKQLRYKMLLGRRDLKNFLIDLSKK